MSAQAHTPGPWRESWDYKRISPCSETVIAFGVGPQITGKGTRLDDGKFFQPNKEMSERMFADARLIAAAPDMLALLQDLYDHGYTTCSDHDRVKAVIKKATNAEPSNG